MYLYVKSIHIFMFKDTEIYVFIYCNIGFKAFQEFTTLQDPTMMHHIHKHLHIYLCICTQYSLPPKMNHIYIYIYLSINNYLH
jgi:hypothetical protein